MNMFRPTALAITAALTFSANSYAGGVQVDTQCNIELNNDLTITPDHILVIENQKTIIDIANDRDLFINGEQMDLNYEQQQWLTDYSTSIRQAIPEVAEIAIEAVDIAFEAIDSSLGQFVDLDLDREKFEEVKRLISDKYISGEGNYHFRGGELNLSTEEDEKIDQLVEEIVSDAMPRMIGGLLATIGQAIANGDADMSEIENMGDKIEREMEAKAEVIEAKADLFCQKMRGVDDLENRLVASNSDFEYLNVLVVKDNR